MTLVLSYDLQKRGKNRKSVHYHPERLRMRADSNEEVTTGRGKKGKLVELPPQSVL